MRANTSRHKAMSYGRLAEAQLADEIGQTLAQMNELNEREDWEHGNGDVAELIPLLEPVEVNELRVPRRGTGGPRLRAAWSGEDLRGVESALRGVEPTGAVVASSSMKAGIRRAPTPTLGSGS